jgi:2-dehydro-3-deoxy-D-arabinonate dehydratase
MRLCRLDNAEGGTLCVVEGDELFAIADQRDLAERIAARPEVETLEELIEDCSVSTEPLATLEGSDDRLASPVRPPEVWAAGVTYERSRDARQQESDSERDAYTKVYESERPELFFKATGWRVVGPRDPVGLRSDSSELVPEAELGLLLGGRGQILGYLLGNDQTSRDIEAANTLYLPQAKVFAGSCALGPVIASTTAVKQLSDLTIELRVVRDGAAVYKGESSLGGLRRDPGELVSYLRHDNPIPPGSVLLTGTGIVPPDGFALAPGDLIEISAVGLGRLANTCRPAADLVELLAAA